MFLGEAYCQNFQLTEAPRSVTTEAHHTKYTTAWLVALGRLVANRCFEFSLHSALCDTYSSLPGNDRQFLPGTLASTLPGYACQFPGWNACQSLPGTLAGALPGHAWEQSPVPCRRTYASFFSLFFNLGAHSQAWYAGDRPCFVRIF